MLKYVIKRLLWIIPVLIGVIIIVFTISYFMPGDPVDMILGGDYTQEEYDEKQAELGLDQPYYKQLFNYFYNLVVNHSLGISYSSGRGVVEELTAANRIWTSMKLGLMSCILTIIVAIPMGIIVAIKQNSILDYIITTVSVFVASMPSFWVALMLILLFTVQLNLLPATGLNSWQSYILPVVCNALAAMATTVRMTRSSMLEVKNQDYVRTARAKGLSELTVITRHALKNALIPIITAVGGQFSMIIGGSVVIETIFNINGMGSMLVSAINNRDYQMILGITVIISTFTMVIMLGVDLVYAAVDPRVKDEFSKGNGWKHRKKRERAEKGGTAG